jgi:hypothetical protein
MSQGRDVLKDGIERLKWVADHEEIALCICCYFSTRLRAESLYATLVPSYSALNKWLLAAAGRLGVSYNTY